MCCQSNPPMEQSALRAVTRTSEPEKAHETIQKSNCGYCMVFFCAEKRERKIKDEMENKLMEVRYQDEAQKI